MNRQKFSTYDIVAVGVMAAAIYAATMFLKIGPIPTPAGPTQLKMGNALCLLAGLLFGGLRGGLAAGIGSALFDLSNPMFAPSAPFTLVFFFIMSCLTGVISHLHGAEGKNTKLNILASVIGSASYMVLHIGKSLIVLVLEGSAFSAALATCSVKLVTSSVNAVFAVIVAALLAPVCRKALSQAGLSSKLFPTKAAL